MHQLRQLHQGLPGGLITKEDFPVPIENGWDLCIDCGHCVAICPTGAMHQRRWGLKIARRSIFI